MTLVCFFLSFFPFPLPVVPRQSADSLRNRIRRSSCLRQRWQLLCKSMKVASCESRKKGLMEDLSTVLNEERRLLPTIFLFVLCFFQEIEKVDISQSTKNDFRTLSHTPAQIVSFVPLPGGTKTCEVGHIRTLVVEQLVTKVTSSSFSETWTKSTIEAAWVKLRQKTI